MSLAVAIPFGVAAAVTYGASTAAQHRAVRRFAGDAGLLRDAGWLLSVGGDGLGVLLQVIALATGPAVLVQPLLVLAVPVALPAGYLLGGPRPGRAALLACAGIVAGLGGFFALVGAPPPVRPAAPAALLVLVVATLAAGLLACLGVRARRPVLRAAGYGAVAGAWFGVVAVLVNAAADEVQRAGVASLVTHERGVLALLGVLVLGGCAFALTQLAFHAGPLAASFPASETVAPCTAVIVGALLLHETIPAGGWRLLGYLVCTAVVVAATVYLARDATMGPARVRPPIPPTVHAQAVEPTPDE